MKIEYFLGEEKAKTEEKQSRSRSKGRSKCCVFLFNFCLGKAEKEEVRSQPN
jgi:hypothetical protein